MTLTNKQFRILLDLFNELNGVFRVLPHDVQLAFYDRLYSKT